MQIALVSTARNITMVYVIIYNTEYNRALSETNTSATKTKLVIKKCARRALKNAKPSVCE